MQETPQELQTAKFRRLSVVFLLGISSGLPLALTRGTLQAWLTESGVDIKTIGIFALVGYPYTFKFLWSPLMVRFSPTVLGGGLRSWLLLTQLLLVAAIASFAFVDPKQSVMGIALLALTTAFLSSSHDIAVDGYRASVLGEREMGRGAGLAIMGYRIAMIVSGAGALLLAEHLSWPQVYLGMSVLMLMGIVVTILSPKPEVAARKAVTLREAVIVPFNDFFIRDGAILILAFIVFYKLGAVMALALETKFLLSIGFQKAQIAYVAKGFGLAAVIAGSMIGGSLRDYLGERRAIIWFGILQGISILLFVWLARSGNNMTVLSWSMGVENFCSGLSQAALTAYLMRLCNRELATTQYALLSSLTAIPPVLCASLSGYFVEALGWEQYFLFCSLLSVPGLILFIILRPQKPESL